MLIAVIILTIVVPFLVINGLRFHMSLYKRGAFPSKAPITPSPTHRYDQITVEDKNDDEVYWSLV